MFELNECLNTFSKKYNSIQIQKETLDITECFYSSAKYEYLAPKSFGNLRENKVLLYVVFGAPFMKKYDFQNGKLKYENGKFIVQKPTKEFTAISCICVGKIKTVSLHEVLDAFKLKKTRNVQGFRIEALKKITKKIKQLYPNWNETTDTAFLFAGKQEELQKSIQLSQTWLEQIATLGENSLAVMTRTESHLVTDLFDTNQAEKYTYSFSNQVTLPQTAEFLKYKFKLAKQLTIQIPIPAKN